MAEKNVCAQQCIGCSGCEQNAAYFCKSCHADLCQECAFKHTENENSPHHVVIYSEKYMHAEIESAPVREIEEMAKEKKMTTDINSDVPTVDGKPEMCNLHPKMIYGMCCKECKVPVCIRCVKENHNGHVFIDTSEFYELVKGELQMRVSDMCSSQIPRLQTTLNQAVQGRVLCIEAFRKVKSELISDTDQAKKLLNENLTCNLKVMDDIESMLTEDYLERERDIQNNLSDLQNAAQRYDELQTSQRWAEMINNHYSQLKNPSVKFKNIAPVVSQINYNRDTTMALDDISNLFGCLTIQPGNVQELKRIKEYTQKKTKIQVKFLPVVQKIMDFEVLGIAHASHISYIGDGMAFFSDNNSRLVLANVRGEATTENTTMLNSGYGCHALTQEKDLLIIDLPKHQICKITEEKKIISILNTGKWTPTTLHCSSRNGDILVGMFFKHDAKVVRYSDKGKELNESQKDADDSNLYRNPCYITENINGDICVSDWNRERLIVLNREGQHKFSYSGRDSRFYPRGVVTDDLGRILVCDCWSDTVHVLDPVGQKIAIIQTKIFGVEGPLSICFGTKGYLWIGNWFNNVITVLNVTME